MKTYCVKCKKDTENIDPKIEQKIIDSYAIKMLCLLNQKIKICKRTRSKRFI